MSPVLRHIFSHLGRFLRDESGQDLIEYALLSAAVAVAAGALMPPISQGIGGIFTKVTSLANRAAGNTATPTAN